MAAIFLGYCLFYLFKSNLGPSPAIDSPGFEGIKLILKIFTDFAASGNPNVSELGVKWLPATFDAPFKGLNIDEKKCELVEFPEAKTCEIYDRIFNELKKELY